MTNQEFPELHQLLGGYFHQDFLLVYGNAEEAIRRFASDALQDEVREVCAEITAILAETEDDERLCALLGELGCEYLPQLDGWPNTRAWLLHVRDRLRGST